MRFDPRRVVLWLSMLLSVSFYSAISSAQTNTVGSIFGSADPASGTRVVATDARTGAVRSASLDADGHFQITALPPGTYKVTLQKGDQVVSTKDVSVAVGAGSEVTFAAAGAQQLDTLQVTGKAGQYDIDVSSTDTRTTFTADRLEKMTVGRAIEEVALLAPGAVRGDSRYTTNRGQSAASFGGSGANENAFYINGYAVTDVTSGLGSSSLPFAGIDQLQLLTGGYSAEFGRSTGGVLNIVTKRGSNYLQAGGLFQYAPKSLRAAEKDIYYPINGVPASDGKLWRETSKRETDSMVYGAYVSGPIVPNHAFFYLSGELENRTVEGPRSLGNVTGTADTGGNNGWYDRDITVPRVLGKLDWTIIDGHSLEFTLVSDVRKEQRDEYQYCYRGTTCGALPYRTKGTQQGGHEYTEGGNLYIGRYTGALMDNLILTALIGQQRNAHKDIITFGYDPSTPAVRDNTGNYGTSGAVTTVRDPDAYDGSKGYRLDLEWILTDHSLRGGYDVQNLTYRDATVSSGPGFIWLYDTTSDPNGDIPGSGGATFNTDCSVNPCDYVEKVRTATGGTFTTDQFAFFVEDRWQVTNDVMVSLGLRNENFKNYNSDKVIFIEQTNQWAPRLGATWDTFGDSSLRVFGNLGRYHLAIPLNVAFRQVGGSLNTSEYFSFTGYDPNTFEPTGTAPIGNGPFSPNQEYGQARDPSLAAASGLKPYYQDEFALGAEMKLMSSLVGGARFIYRKLGSQIDDNCDFRPAYNWAVENGYVSNTDNSDILSGDAYGAGTANGLDDRAEYIGSQLAQCRIINPGESNTISFQDIDSNGDGVADAQSTKFSATIPASNFGLDKLDRTYKGLDLFIEHAFRDNWYGKLDWTLSKNRGNAEGQLLSDNGQQDVSVTANWDHPEIMKGGNGYLPNDRTHQIKAYGFYQLSPEWRASLTMNSLSGRPKSPKGLNNGVALLAIEPTTVNPNPDSDQIFNDYVAYPGANYYYTNGNPSPRGSGGRLPWTTTFDVGGSYSPNFMQNQLGLSLDVFNVFNTQKVQSMVEAYETAAPGVKYHSWSRPISYNSPRSVRFTVRYDWGL